MKQPLAALLLIIMASASTLATPPEIPARFAFSLRPARSARPPGPVDLEYLCAKTKYASDSIGIMQFRVENPEDVRLLSAATWTADMTVRDTVRHIVTVDVQPTDTVFIRVTGASRCLWIQNDTLAHSYRCPSDGHAYFDPWSQALENYSHEQLAEEHDFTIDLRQINRIWIQNHDSLLSTSQPPIDLDSVFHGRANTKFIIELQRNGIPVDVTLPPPTNYTPPAEDADTFPSPSNSQSQGYYPNRTPTNVFLAGVEGESTPGYLGCGDTIRFHIGIDNNTGTYIGGMSNGFRIYSQGGAQWDTTTAVIHSSVSSYFDLVNAVVERNTDGITDDTIGFGHSIMYGPGIPNGFEDTAWTISIGPIDASYVGREICLDSCWYPPTGTWLWATTRYVPTWDGPHCWDIQAASYVDVSGYLFYIDPTPPAAGDSVKPVRNSVVEIWDQDAGGDQKLATVGTNESGFFSKDSVINLDQNGTGGQDIYLVVKLNGQDAQVVRKGGTPYTWTTSVDYNVSGSSYARADTCFSDSSDAAFVADKTHAGHITWYDLGLGFLGTTNVILDTDTSITGYNPAQDYIFINATDSALTRWPDTWNATTIVHELGHRIAYLFSFCDSGGGNHRIDTIISPEMAAYEGFPNFWSALVADTSFRAMYWNNFADSFWTDWENGEYGLDEGGMVSVWGSVNARTLSNEGAVACLLWDIYDNTAGLEDYSDSTDWGTLNLGPNTDGIGDSLSIPAADILSVFVDRQVSGRGPITMQEFFDRWFEQPSLQHPQAMLDIWYEHGEPLDCCTGITGDIDGDGSYDPTISDLVYLVDYMFTGGPEPWCWKESNVDGLSQDRPDISDLVYLVTYMFSGGPALPSCSSFKAGRVDQARVLAQ